MDWKQFVASVISSLSWPIAVVLVVALLRASLMGLIPKIRSLKYGDLHIDLGKELDAVKAEISVHSTDAEVPETPPVAPTTSTIELASLSPRAAVLTSWLEVEKEIDHTISKHHIRIANPHKNHPGLKMRVLRDKNLIDENTMSTFKKLYDLRNKAAHLTDVDVGYGDAITMAELCEWLIQKLKEASPG